MKTDATPKKPLTFEKAMTRLEDIVREMESDTADLDAMVAAFEEGRTLVKFCTDKLNEVERKIEILTKTDDGTTTAEPFSEELVQ